MLKEIFIQALHKNELFKLMGTIESKDMSEALVHSISKRLDIVLASPEKEIVKEG